MVDAAVLSNYETPIVNRIPQGRGVVTADDDDVGKSLASERFSADYHTVSNSDHCKFIKR